MEYENLIVDFEGDVAFVSINRPRKGNSLSESTVGELLEFFSQDPSKAGARVAVVRGGGEKFFCAGSDIGDLSKRDTAETEGGFTLLSSMYEAVRKSRIISIAAVRGLALGGGCGLTASCDIAIASNLAQFGLPEINLGIAPMIVLLPMIRAIGHKMAFNMAARGHRISAQEALAFGLISEVVEDGKLDGEVRKIASELAAQSGVALGIIKKGIQEAEKFNYVDAYYYMNELINLNMATEDAKEGLSAFMEKRQPRWKHR